MGTRSPLWAAAWHLLFYVSLAIAVAQAELLQRGADVGTAALSAVLAAWYGYWMVLRPDRLFASGPWRGLYFAVAGGIWAALTLSEGAYGLLAYSAFAQILGYLSARAAILALLVAMGILYLPEMIYGGGLSSDDLISAGLTLALIGVVSVSFRAVARQNWERQRLIEQLQRTRLELAGAEREAGVLQERQRLAADIHDTVTQGLASIVMLLEAAKGELADSSAATAGYVDQALQSARDHLRDVRRTVWGLRPESLEEATLPDAVARIARQFEAETSITANVRVTGSARRLPTEHEVTLLRVVQEGLSNVRRHAESGSASITLSYLPTQVDLKLADSGVGFDADQLPADPSPEGGVGLFAMRERVAALDGILSVESEPGEGTVISVQLPVPEVWTSRTNAVKEAAT